MTTLSAREHVVPQVPLQVPQPLPRFGTVLPLGQHQNDTQIYPIHAHLSRAHWAKSLFWTTQSKLGQKRLTPGSYLHGFLQLLCIKHSRRSHEGHHELPEVAGEVALQVVFQFLQ